jgi:hypothetical protein
MRLCLPQGEATYSILVTTYCCNVSHFQWTAYSRSVRLTEAATILNPLRSLSLEGWVKYKRWHNVGSILHHYTTRTYRKTAKSNFLHSAASETRYQWNIKTLFQDHQTLFLIFKNVPKRWLFSVQYFAPCKQLYMFRVKHSPILWWQTVCDLPYVTYCHHQML